MRLFTLKVLLIREMPRISISEVLLWYKSVSEQGHTRFSQCHHLRKQDSQRGREKDLAGNPSPSPRQSLALLQETEEAVTSSAALSTFPRELSDWLSRCASRLPACVLTSGALPCLLAPPSKALGTVSRLCLFTGSAPLPSCTDKRSPHTRNC